MASISWVSGVSGDWTNNQDWTGGIAPGANDDATIAATGTYTVGISSAVAARSLTIDDANAIVIDTGALALGGTLNLAAGAFDLDGGVISGGTLSAAGGAFLWDGGLLDGVTYDGTLSLTKRSSLEISSKGLLVKGQGGVGSGKIDLSAADCTLYLDGDQTLDDATVDLNGYGKGGSALVLKDTTGAGATLTLGANLTIDQAGRYETAFLKADRPQDTILNQGVIDAVAIRSSFVIGPSNFINAGAITVSNGDLFIVQPGVDFTNRGMIAISGGASLMVQSAVGFANTGAITVSQASLTFYCHLTTAGLAGVVNDAGTVTIESDIDNTGAILNVGSGAQLGQVTLVRFQGGAGTIVGGTIVDSGSGLIFKGGVLDGVTYDGTLNVSSPGPGATITSQGLIVRSVDGASDGVVNVAAGTAMVFQGAQTFDHATINLAGGIDGNDTTGKGAVLTLGPNLTVDVTGPGAGLGGPTFDGDAIVNEGAIDLAPGAAFSLGVATFVNAGTIDVASGDSLSLAPDTFINAAAGAITLESGATLTVNSAAWTNAGAITATGARIVLDGQVDTATLDSVQCTDCTVLLAGTLQNAGAILSVGQGAGLGTVTLANLGTVMGGTIEDSGGGMTYANGVFDGVTYDGVLKLETQIATLSVKGAGLTVRSADGRRDGVIDLTGGGSELNFYGSQTLDDATLNLGSNAATTYLYEDDTFDPGATLTLGPNLDVKTTGKYALIWNRGDSSSTICNDGVIEASVAAGQVTIRADTFINQGTIAVSGGDTVQILGAFTDTASAALSVGTGSTLTFYGGAADIEGAITGNGDLAVAYTAFSLNGAAALSVADWSLSLGAVVTVNETLSYAGTFTQGLATLSIAAGDEMTLTGPATFDTSAVLDGGGALRLSKATLAGLTLGGTVALDDVGEIDQTGAVNMAGSSARIVVDAGATYRIAADAGISQGGEVASQIRKGGLFIKSGTGGTSTIDVKWADWGAIEAATGTLDFTRALKGGGSAVVNGGATLEADAGVGSALSVTFNGPSATLAIGRAGKFMAAIGGFAATDTIHLLNQRATSAVLGAGDTLVISNKAKVVATLQLAGDYAGDTFTVGSDGKGGTNVAVSTGAAVPPVASPRATHRFVAALAALAPNEGPAPVTAQGHGAAWPPLISAPRTQAA